jgi:hypothetical protein
MFMLHHLPVTLKEDLQLSYLWLPLTAFEDGCFLSPKVRIKSATLAMS